MTQRWKNRPEGSNWGEFGPDDEKGRMNLLTPERVLRAVAEVKEGRTFCLSLPLDLPGGTKLNPRRMPPVLQPVTREGQVAFNLRLSVAHEQLTDVTCDDGVLLYNQYSTQWDSFAHCGSVFDADGDGVPESVFYNGHHVVDPETGQGTQGPIGAVRLGIENMAETCVQGRGVMLDLHAHFPGQGRGIGYDELMRVMDADKVEVEEGDMLLIHTNFGQMLVDMAGDPDPAALFGGCPALDGTDPKLVQWVTDSGVAALIADSRAVEYERGQLNRRADRGPNLSLHEHCLFKLGVHLGEMWYLTELANWLRAKGRNRFLLTAPPLRLPGAVGSPATPVATV